MKKDTHPTYYENANVKCACGNKFTVGSTNPEIEVEVCYKCHPFYTGKENLIDVVGKVEKFKKRKAKASQAKIRSKTAKRTAKKAKKAKKVSTASF